ncbi:Mitochondrial inner membrane protease subunit [Lachnellula suecica]|uniref:Mitochondrial inner membrane protease subunit 2 n=1 Tax=Lachnellula suecica TaxID=602035 RepID=A0A8T9C561_9HELO|nr:Mitochondrial inner membrane protease subunit [Lachnellula suecica]
MSSNRILSAFRRDNPSGQSIRRFGRTLFFWASWVPAIIFFNENVGEVTIINGPSMYPYLNTGYNESNSRDLCWVNKRKPAHNLERGMLVSFSSVNTPERTAIKRVIALPGDRVVTRAPYPIPVVDIPQNHIWVEGDNKDGNKTLDSNTYGPISMSLLQGKITRVLWPWNSAGQIRWWEFKGRTKVIKGKGEDAPGWE